MAFDVQIDPLVDPNMVIRPEATCYRVSIPAKQPLRAGKMLEGWRKRVRVELEALSRRPSREPKS
jgi:hypothetical protein